MLKREASRKPVSVETPKERRERRHRESLLAVRRYLVDFGITKEHLNSKKIADIGGGRSASFTEGASELIPLADVISIDKDKCSEDLPSQIKKKCFGSVDFLNDDLQTIMKTDDVPQFDYLLFKNSLPYYEIIENQDPIDGSWKNLGGDIPALPEERRVARLNFLHTIIGKTLKQAARYLAPGGYSLHHPIFDGGLFKFGHKGGLYDFHDWRDVLDQEIKKFKKENKDFDCYLQPTAETGFKDAEGKLLGEAIPTSRMVIKRLK